jgi:hypothetical protein
MESVDSSLLDDDNYSKFEQSGGSKRRKHKRRKTRKTK